MKHMHEDGIVQLSTLDIIKSFIKNRRIEKQDLRKTDMPFMDDSANYIAVILDNEVQEVLRAQNRLTALFLSNPKFVEFNPKEVYPKVGWGYIDGKFIEESSSDE